MNRYLTIGINLDCTIRNKPQAIIDIIRRDYDLVITRDMFCSYPPPLHQALRANGVEICKETYREKYWGRASQNLDLIAPAFDRAACGMHWLKPHFGVVVLHDSLQPERMIECWLQDHSCYWDEIMFVDDPEKLSIADRIDILIDDNPQTLWAWGNWPRNLRVIKAAMVPWNRDINIPIVMDSWDNIRVVMEAFLS